MKLSDCLFGLGICFGVLGALWAFFVGTFDVGV